MIGKHRMAWAIGTIIVVAAVLGGVVKLSSGPGALADSLFGLGAEASPDDPLLKASFGDPDSSSLSAWPGKIDAEITAYDLDGDGTKELLAQSKDRHIYVFSVKDGDVVAKLPMRYPPGWHIDSVLNQVEAGVLEPGQPPSIVAANHAAIVTVWQYDGKAGDEFRFKQVWEERPSGCYRSPGMDAKPVLADLTGDGTTEIILQTEEVGLHVFRSNGTELWQQCWAGGNSAPVVDDLDGDGKLEVVFASDAGFVSVFDGATGAPQWTFDARDYGVKPASIIVSPTIADIDGKGAKEILFTTRNAPVDDPEQYEDFRLVMFAVHQNQTTWKAEPLWIRQPDWANPMSHTQFVVRDVDGDGTADIFGMDWNTVGHRPGNWENLGPAHLFRLDAQGNDVWVREVDSWWSNKEIIMGDHDGDGGPDLLVNGARGGHDGFWRIDAETGKSLGFLATKGWKVMRAPVVNDLDSDGSLEVAFPVMPEDGTEVGAVLVYDIGVPADSPWSEAT